MKTGRLVWVLVGIFSLALFASCGRSGVDDEPLVKILSPSDSATIPFGETVHIESRSRDDYGIRQVEMRVNGVPVDVQDVPKGEKSFRLQQSWSPPDPGTYSVTVVAYDDRGQMRESAAISLTVQSTALSAESSLPTAQDTRAPSLTPDQTVSEYGDCSFDAIFVTDVTIPDNTPIPPGGVFVKTWRLRNSGTCGWGTGVRLVFVHGEQMGSPTALDVPPTAAGTMVDISARFQAPQTLGTHRGTWRMRAPDGSYFGNSPYVQIVVDSSAPPSSAPAASTSTEAVRPDLDVTFVPERLELSVGQSLELKVTIRNHGPGKTDRPAVVRAVAGDTLQIENQVAILPVYGVGTTSLSYTFDQPMELDLVITVDPDNEIFETDEGNNVERVHLSVIPSP